MGEAILNKDFSTFAELTMKVYWFGFALPFRNLYQRNSQIK